MPGDLQFLNSFKVLRHSSSETTPSHDDFSSSFKEVTFSLAKKVRVAGHRIVGIHFVIPSGNRISRKVIISHGLLRF